MDRVAVVVGIPAGYIDRARQVTDAECLAPNTKKEGLPGFRVDAKLNHLALSVGSNPPFYIMRLR